MRSLSSLLNLGGHLSIVTGLTTMSRRHLRSVLKLATLDVAVLSLRKLKVLIRNLVLHWSVLGLRTLQQTILDSFLGLSFTALSRILPSR